MLVSTQGSFAGERFLALITVVTIRRVLIHVPRKRMSFKEYLTASVTRVVAILQRARIHLLSFISFHA